MCVLYTITRAANIFNTFGGVWFKNLKTRISKRLLWWLMRIKMLKSTSTYFVKNTETQN